tara:strand:- start:243 stop:1178 length:936 start_codon:yes stop_codon:yes gene_type:complete
MAKKVINIGKSQNKGDGDPLRTAFSKVNDNFDELYSGTFTDTTQFGTSIIPATDNAISLGSSTKRWSELYVKDFIFINGVRLSGSASGDLVVGGNVVQAKDIVGSIFADDSKLMMDGLTGILYGPMIGDVTGSVFADNSTVLVDGISGKITLGNNTTDDLPEGSTNKYFNGKTTDDLPQGLSNEYYTNAKFDNQLSTKNTDNLSEGASNKYYSSTLANADIDTRVTQSFVNNLNITATQVGNITASASVIDTDDSSTITFTPAVKISSDLTVENDIIPNNIVGYISNVELKNIAAASADFADFKTRIATLP